MILKIIVILFFNKEFIRMKMYEGGYFFKWLSIFLKFVIIEVCVKRIMVDLDWLFWLILWNY